jgi:hypothetical protein
VSGLGFLILSFELKEQRTGRLKVLRIENFKLEEEREAGEEEQGR